MSWWDAAGLTGVLLIATAYAAAALGRMDAKRAPSLICNAVGASLVLASLSQEFNLSATVMEAVWLLIALAGLGRLALRRRG